MSPPSDENAGWWDRRDEGADDENAGDENAGNRQDFVSEIICTAESDSDFCELHVDGLVGEADA